MLFSDYNFRRYTDDEITQFLSQLTVPHVQEYVKGNIVRKCSDTLYFYDKYICDRLGNFFLFMDAYHVLIRRKTVPVHIKNLFIRYFVSYYDTLESITTDGWNTHDGSDSITIKIEEKKSMYKNMYNFFRTVQVFIQFSYMTGISDVTELVDKIGKKIRLFKSDTERVRLKRTNYTKKNKYLFNVSEEPVIEQVKRDLTIITIHTVKYLPMLFLEKKPRTVTIGSYFTQEHPASNNSE